MSCWGYDGVYITAYGIAVKHGFSGSEKDWLLSLRGERGADGAQGQPGADGADGERGERGFTFTPSVSPDGILTWSNDGELKNPSEVNLTGPAGPRGERGEQGPPGENGADGKQGERGEQGPPGADGERGERGFTFTPSIADGVLHWENDGGLPNPPDVSLVGTPGISDEDIDSICV